jgi:hypothetical protein
MKRRLITPLLACLLAVAATAPLVAQEDQRIYTRVALWQVERARWSDFVEWFETYDQPVMEQLFADGTVVEWGLDASSLHRPDGYTHGTWFSSTSLADLEAVLDAFDADMEARGDEGADALADFASMITGHRDYLLRDLVRGATDAQLDGGYWVGNFSNVKPGEGSAYRSYWDEHTEPLFESLLADGTIVAYGLTVEDVITEGFGGRTSWYIVPNAAGLDAVGAAFRATWQALSDEGRRARIASIIAFSEEGSFQEFISELGHYAVKAN